MSTMFDLREFDTVGEEGQRVLWARFIRAIKRDDGEAAQSHLRAGRPVYYCDDHIQDAIIREWPDGRKELVKVAEDGKVDVISESVGKASNGREI